MAVSFKSLCGRVAASRAMWTAAGPLSIANLGRPTLSVLVLIVGVIFVSSLVSANRERRQHPVTAVNCERVIGRPLYVGRNEYAGAASCKNSTRRSTDPRR